jgi:hypothetical protein
MVGKSVPEHLHMVGESVPEHLHMVGRSVLKIYTWLKGVYPKQYGTQRVQGCEPKNFTRVVDTYILNITQCFRAWAEHLQRVEGRLLRTLHRIAVHVP